MKQASGKLFHVDLRNYGDGWPEKKLQDLTAEDILAETAGMLSVFLKDPQFQGQTKDKLVPADATKPN